MANYLVTDTEFSQIASAVRSKLGKTNSFVYPAGLADAIDSITNIKYIYDANYPSLSYIYNKFCTSIKANAFASFNFLTSVSFPACTTIGYAAFANCASLTTVSFPVCTTIGNGAFNGCSFLISVSFPSCTTIMSYAFYYCSSLTSVSFPACTTIERFAFGYCSSLSQIYLAKNSVVTLAAGAFLGTKITSTTGSIRVPSNLVNSYKVAKYWSAYSNRIFAI